MHKDELQKRMASMGFDEAAALMDEHGPCPWGDPMHFHHDHCPSCWNAEQDRVDPLFKADEDEPVAFVCNECGVVSAGEEAAIKCCAPWFCDTCGQKVHQYRTRCRPCQRQAHIDAARQNDQIVPLDQAEWPLFVDGRIVHDECDVEYLWDDWGELPDHARGHIREEFAPDIVQWVEWELEDHVGHLDDPDYYTAEWSAWMQKAHDVLRPLFELIQRRLPTMVVYYESSTWVDITPLHPKD